MLTPGRIAPARPWRAFFIFLAALVGGAAIAAPAAKPPELAQVGKPGPEEAARLVTQFRNSGIPGEYYLEFELRTLPRRGKGETFKGRWWGARNEQGALTRLEVTDGRGAAHRLLLQNGEQAKVWRWVNGRAAELGVAELMAPLVPGVEISAFDLQMPYLYWPGATVEKIVRVLGRPTYAFLFNPPAAFSSQFKDVTAMRAYFDAKFNVPMQAETMGTHGRVIKTLALISLKTVDQQTLPKEADYRNEVTRDKTRLAITAAALKLDLPATIFEPASLAQAAALPPASRIVRIDP